MYFFNLIVLGHKPATCVRTEIPPNPQRNDVSNILTFVGINRERLRINKPYVISNPPAVSILK